MTLYRPLVPAFARARISPLYLNSMASSPSTNVVVTWIPWTGKSLELNKLRGAEGANIACRMFRGNSLRSINFA